MRTLVVLFLVACSMVVATFSLVRKPHKIHLLT
jgi:hypothetical protein